MCPRPVRRTYNTWCSQSCRNKDPDWSGHRRNRRHQLSCKMCGIVVIADSSTQIYCKICAPTGAAMQRCKRYGLAEPAYQAMLVKQGNACAICKTTFTNSPHVDHNHVTGVVRGLLCGNCNRRLEVVEDRQFVKQATQYLLCDRLSDVVGAGPAQDTKADEAGPDQGVVAGVVHEPDSTTPGPAFHRVILTRFPATPQPKPLMQTMQ